MVNKNYDIDDFTREIKRQWEDLRMGDPTTPAACRDFLEALFKIRTERFALGVIRRNKRKDLKEELKDLDDKIPKGERLVSVLPVPWL